MEVSYLDTLQFAVCSLSTSPRTRVRGSASSLWIVQFVKINVCGRVALICAFSCESSVSEVSDWIIKAERQCSRTPRIESSKLQDRRGRQGAKRDIIQRFTAAAFMAHESPTTALLTRRANNECQRNTKNVSSAHTQRQKSWHHRRRMRGKSGQCHASGVAQINSKTRSGNLELMFPFCDV